jgi:hypothetical protein
MDMDEFHHARRLTQECTSSDAWPFMRGAQPPEGNDKFGDAINALYEIVKKPKAN